MPACASSRDPEYTALCMAEHTVERATAREGDNQAAPAVRTQPKRDRRCPCGHGRGHPYVQQEADYSLWGWIVLSMFGITPAPKRIIFRCIRCRTSLGSTRDPTLLHKKQMPDKQGHDLPTAPPDANAK